MITSKKELKQFLQLDAKVNSRVRLKPKIFGDEIWKYQICLRKLEYYTNTNKLLSKLFYKFRFHKYSIMLGFEIPINVCDMGLSLPRRGPIIISKGAKIGKCCRIHEGVTIGATNGSNKAATISDNVFISTGAKIIGDVFIASDCTIGANAVVTKSIVEVGTTWGGIPAKKISDNDSHSNLQYFLPNEN